MYYRNGSTANGNISAGGETYRFSGGKLFTGFIREGGKLYYYKSGTRERSTVVGSSATGYYYADETGLCYEGEDMRLAADFIMRYGTGNTLKERMKTAYLYMAHHYPYQRRYYEPAKGSDMPAIAIDMFKNKGGNCYCFGAAMAYVAKIAGYRARMGLGETSRAHIDHGWTEVYVDGKWVYCDCQAEIPQFEYPDYTMYLVADHPWKVITHWHTELTLENGQAVWK